MTDATLVSAANLAMILAAMAFAGAGTGYALAFQKIRKKGSHTTKRGTYTFIAREKEGQ